MRLDFMCHSLGLVQNNYPVAALLPAHAGAAGAPGKPPFVQHGKASAESDAAEEP